MRPFREAATMTASGSVAQGGRPAQETGHERNARGQQLELQAGGWEQLELRPGGRKQLELHPGGRKQLELRVEAAMRGSAAVVGEDR